MSATVDLLPLTDTLTPADQPELAEIVRDAYADGTPIYPIGGATSLDFGLPAAESGIGLSLAGLRRVIDYAARDMTITVEAGITMDLLASTLAKENQRLPIDLPEAHRASLGGVIATNTSGARRYGHGTVRDYVIGITAVDGRGDVFHGGGRVVKNVAGYDFCKLLTGSLGTLGVITQVTLRVKPIPECSRLVACAVRGWDSAERVLQSLVTTQSTPVAIEFVAGDAWNAEAAIGPRDDSVGCAVLGLEGTEPEVKWMAQAVCEELQSVGERPVVLSEHESSRLWMRLAQFPVEGNAALVVKASLKPSQMLQFIRTLRYIDPGCSIQAHAGNGIVVARFPQLDAGRLSRMLVVQLQPTAAEHEGHMIVLSCRWPQELTRQAAWGSIGASAAAMEEIKRQFDPKNLLNRGRFIFAGR